MPHNFKDFKKGILWTAAAGPISNMIIALGFGILFRSVQVMIPVGQFYEIALRFCAYGVLINCALAFFNMIPLPPLDGSKVLFGLLPDRYDHIAVRLERIGPFGLMILIGIGFLTGHSAIWMIIGPFVGFFFSFFTGVPY
jgi:Zn-dependent protease